MIFWGAFVVPYPKMHFAQKSSVLGAAPCPRGPRDKLLQTWQGLALSFLGHDCHPPTLAELQQWRGPGAAPKTLLHSFPAQDEPGGAGTAPAPMGLPSVLLQPLHDLRAAHRDNLHHPEEETEVQSGEVLAQSHAEGTQQRQIGKQRPLSQAQVLSPAPP